MFSSIIQFVDYERKEFQKLLPRISIVILYIYIY